MIPILYAVRHPVTGWWLLFDDDRDVPRPSALLGMATEALPLPDADARQPTTTRAWWTERMNSNHLGNYQDGMRDAATEFGGELVTFDYTSLAARLDALTEAVRPALQALEGATEGEWQYQNGRVFQGSTERMVFTASTLPKNGNYHDLVAACAAVNAIRTAQDIINAPLHRSPDHDSHGPAQH